VDCQKAHAGIMKHGGGMRKLLKQCKGKEEKLWKLEKRNLKEAWKEFNKTKQNAKRVISLAKGKK